MVFTSHENLTVDPPDDIVISDVVLNPRFGRRPLSQSNKTVFIDAPTGAAFDLATVQNRMECLANGLSKVLDIDVPWKGVIALFSPNHVLPL
jgi:hypothetical protein